MPIPLGIFAVAGAGAGGPADKYLVVGSNTSPRLFGYPFSASGFGTKYSDPSAIPAGAFTVHFYPNGNDLLATNSSGSDYNMYPMTASGFGTRYSLVYGSYTHTDSSVSPLGNALTAPVGNQGAYVEAYPFVSGTGIGTKFSNPATGYNGGAGSPYGASSTFSKDGLAVVYADDNFSSGVQIQAWKFSGSGYGTKFTSPANAGAGVNFTATTGAILMSHAVNNFQTAYAFSSTSGFGSKYANPATLPTTTNGGGVDVTPLENAVFFTGDSSPFVYAYPWSGSGYGTKFADPASLPTGGNPHNPKITAALSGRAVAMTTKNTPFVQAYSWSASGWGSKFSNPASIPSAVTNGISFA